MADNSPKFEPAAVNSATQPSVAVVIPVFNRPEPLIEAVLSVRNQGDIQPRIVLVDDASTDGRTPAVVAELSQSDLLIDAVHLQMNSGPGTARNRGVEACDEELIAFLDSDDLMAPGRLDNQHAYLLANRSHQAIVGRLKHYIDPDVVAPEAMLREGIASGDEALYVMTIMIRRSTFTALGGFDEDFRFAEDLDLMTRLRASFLVGEVDEVFTIRRILGDNLSYDTAAIKSSLFQLLRKRNGAGPL